MLLKRPLPTLSSRLTNAVHRRKKTRRAGPPALPLICGHKGCLCLQMRVFQKKGACTALNRKQKVLLTSAAALCLATVIAMIAVLCTPKVQRGTFTPPPFEQSAVVGSPSVPEGLGWQELDAQAFHVGVCGKCIVTDYSADVWLTNPETNTVWLKVRVLDEKGNTLGETGLIKPGEYVQSVTLETVPTDGTPIILKIMAYEPETYYSEGAVTLNTTISKGGAT